MKPRSTLSLALVLLAGGELAAEEFRSGPQVGDAVSGGFRALFLNGDHADKHRCPV